MYGIQRRILGVGLAAIVLVGMVAAVGAETTGKVNINTAAADDLALLPRVGPSVAGRIIQFREENGRFASVEDLMLVRGIGEKTFELIEPYVKLDGETDLKEKVSGSRGAGSAPADSAEGS